MAKNTVFDLTPNEDHPKTEHWTKVHSSPTVKPCNVLFWPGPWKNTPIRLSALVH